MNKDVRTGIIVTWIDHKKFGFIRPDGQDQEIFLHLSDLPGRQPIPVNTRVQFELCVYGGRKKACRVEVIS